MRVLVFTDEYDYSYFTFVYNEVKKLEEAGVEIFVVCERVGKLKETDSDFVNVPLKANKILRSIFWTANRRKLYRLVSLYTYYRRRRKVIREFKPDIIHTHFGDTACRLFFPMRGTLKGIPYLVTFHGFDASSFLKRQHYVDSLKTLILQPEFHGICVSQHLKNNLLGKGLKVNDQNSSILYCGINIDMFHRTRRENNEVRTFLQISGFYEKKGHIYTLKAFKKFLERNKGKARLIIGGDGPLREEILKACKDLGLSDDVVFPGWISRDQAVTLLDEADYFVHHSITAANGDQEGLPNAIIEAMAMELPVISTFHSGIPELVEDGVNGYLVQEKDIDAYAVKMEQILSWSYLTANREKVEKGFSLPVHTDGLISIYRKLLPEKKLST